MCTVATAASSTPAVAVDGREQSARVVSTVDSGSLASARRGAATPSRPVSEAPSVPRLNSSPPSRLLIPRIGLDRSIHRGGQSTIDQGHVTWYDPGGSFWPEPDLPGHPGTFWVAAHRTTAGASFIRLPELAVGDIVHVERADGSVVSFRIHTVTSVPSRVPISTIYGVDPESADITLQTSLPNDRRHIVRGTTI